MKRLYFLSFIFILTTKCSFLPSSCPTRSDYIKSLIELKDTIVFPDKFEILEETFQSSEKENWYNGCFKLSHNDIITFIKRNKLKIETRTYGVFAPSGLGLLKKEQRELRTMPELWKNRSEFYADTIHNKLYISKYY